MNKCMCRFLILVLLSLCSFNMHAQSFSIVKLNGSNNDYRMKEVRKITFTDYTLVVEKKIAVQTVFYQSEFDKIEFTFPILNSVSPTQTKNELQLFPNPFHEKLTIVLPSSGTGAVEVSLLSLDAKLLYRSSHNTNQVGSVLDIPVDHLQKGLYICTVKCDGVIRTQKVIKN